MVCSDIMKKFLCLLMFFNIFSNTQIKQDNTEIIINGMKYHGPLSAELYEIKLEVINNELKLIDIKEKGIA